MNLRNAAIAAVASGLLGLPVAASASEPFDPSTGSATDTVQMAIDQLKIAYASAPLAQRRGIHNDIVLLVNIGRAAL